MSSRMHGRGRKILDLCKTNENEQKELEPSKTISEEWSVVQNVELEYILSDTTDNFSNTFNVENITDSNPVDNNSNHLSSSILNAVILQDIFSMPAPNNTLSFFDATLNSNIINDIVVQNVEQEVQVKDSIVTPLSPLNAPLSNFTKTDEHHRSNNLISEDIIEQCSLEETENNSRNSLTGVASSSIVPSSSNLFNQIDLISDESMQDGLVSYTINSDSESDYENYPEKSKKRKKRVQVQKSSWFAEKNRKLRENGKRYYGRKKEEKWNYKIPKQPRVIENRCLCKETKKGSLKCSKFTETERQNIFKEFWSMSWPEKIVYVNNLVTSLPVKRPRGRKNYKESKRAQSLFYYLKKEDQPIKVCRTMFLKTLGIGRWTVLNWKNNHTVSKRNNKVSDSFQTKNATSKPFELERQELRIFLESLPAMESHYCRASTQKKYLLPEWRSKRLLYDFYVNNWCKTRNVNALSICKFSEEFDIQNLGLYFPKKDQCEICALFKVGNKSQEEHLEHQTKKEEARAEKEKDKSEESFIFTVDMQAVLMAPKSKISSLYYRTKLQIHNLAFYNLNNKNGYCYLWNETEGGVNAEEFASIWVSFIEKKVLQNESEKPTKIIFYSDGCTYQNRNCVMTNALLLTAMNQNIIIEQKFLEVGHTQMEADSIHSSVERALKNKTINVPAEYIGICRSARKNPRPYDVTYLNHTFFKSFDEVKFFKSIRPGRGKGDAKVTDIRALRYTPNGDVFFKLRFTDEWKILPQRKLLTVIALPFDALRNQHLTKIKITKRKFEDLQYLKNTLPEDYRYYYDNLLHD